MIIFENAHEFGVARLDRVVLYFSDKSNTIIVFILEYERVELCDGLSWNALVGESQVFDTVTAEGSRLQGVRLTLPVILNRLLKGFAR